MRDVRYSLCDTFEKSESERFLTPFWIYDFNDFNDFEIRLMNSITHELNNYSITDDSSMVFCGDIDRGLFSVRSGNG